VADLIVPTRIDPKDLQLAAARSALLARRLGGTLQTDNELEVELRRLTRLIELAQGPISTSFEAPELSRISSEAWNRFQDALQIDLRTIYELLGALEAANRQLDQLAQSDLFQIKAAILKSINQLRVHQFLKEYPEYQDLKIVDFVRAVNETKRLPRAYVDPQIRMLELPARFRDTVTYARKDIRSATVETRHFGGGQAGGFGGEAAAVNMLDSNPKTFWAEVVSANGPVQTRFKTSWGMREAVGVVGEIVVKFSHSVRVNNLKLLPFTEFPFEVIDVAFRESLSSVDWITLPGFAVTSHVDDWVEFDFPYVTMAQLRIVIEQPNYTRGVYSIPKSLVHREALWAQIQTAVFDREVHEIDLSSREEGLVAAEPEQLRYLSALALVDERARAITVGGERDTVYRDVVEILSTTGGVSESISPGAFADVLEPVDGGGAASVDEVVNVTRYEYLYGLRSIELAGVLYEPVAYYESAPFDTNGTVYRVELETDERQPEFYDGLGSYRRTSIEYEVEVAPNVRFPIVPLTDLSGADYVVRDEYVRLKDGVGKLRFEPLASSVRVRENGFRVAASRVALSGDQLTVNDALPNGVYTATYYVGSDQTVVDLEEELASTRLLAPELFYGTNRDNAIQLSYYPYTIYEIVRDDRLWTKDPEAAIWRWTPEFFPIVTGTVAVTNGSRTVSLTKSDPDDPDFGDLLAGADYEVKIYLAATGKTYAVESFTDTQLTLAADYAEATASGLQFLCGRSKTWDNRVWGLNLQVYEPIQVFVDDVKAVNTTDYLRGEHPAFSGGTDERKIRYIQAGRNIYFDQSIGKDRKIQVTYSWLIQYLKLVATLRCHVPVDTIYTPKLDSARLRVKSTTL